MNIYIYYVRFRLTINIIVFTPKMREHWNDSNTNLYITDVLACGILKKQEKGGRVEILKTEGEQDGFDRM